MLPGAAAALPGQLRQEGLPELQDAAGTGRTHKDLSPQLQTQILHLKKHEQGRHRDPLIKTDYHETQVNEQVS